MENLELQKIANEVRKDIVTALHAAKAGHPGGSLSACLLYTSPCCSGLQVQGTAISPAARNLSIDCFLVFVKIFGNFGS